MKAAVIDTFGSSANLEVRDIPMPVIGPAEILVEVHAAGVNPIDWKIREGTMRARFGDAFPMVLGLDVSGVVVETGRAVTQFSRGDEVWARSDNGPGGCYAEYATLNPATVACKPVELSHLEAGSMPLAALTCLNGLRDCAQLKADDRLLIVGASGGVGVFALQVAKIMGAHVTAVCSGRNADLVRELGADQVIDYTSEEVFQTDDRYDVIYDAIGTLDFAVAKQHLTDEGIYMTLVPVPGIDFFLPGQTERLAGKGYFVAWTPSGTDLDILAGWVRDGRLKPVIDSIFPLDDIRQAHERSETLRAAGKIVVQVR
ncbi:MAG TPA: NAD(P)-dependent alcohol dehydrogenase [Gammaproteobacteria bacterium]|jgi:NADPH:quinone reductase-like Zn-dependent oxidoreductase|nr:NAD(P)-dependent alcohol dehydrogenase [Gammaproteobacteria bacterium]HJP39316.1 NAD(P)-dependent alcohol dehydrogenase [Gammaproteobacteria bacterium]